MRKKGPFLWVLPRCEARTPKRKSPKVGLKKTPGSDLLSHQWVGSIIGAGGLHFRVRNGVGWDTSALATRRKYEEREKERYITRSISTGQLNALPHVHSRPIYQVVSLGSYCLAAGRAHLVDGFPLRCFQRLSLPIIATLLCRWRDNRSTRGSSTPVLSY